MTCWRIYLVSFVLVNELSLINSIVIFKYLWFDVSRLYSLAIFKAVIPLLYWS